jgi:hypothetical protein
MKNTADVIVDKLIAISSQPISGVERNLGEISERLCYPFGDEA